MPIGRRRKKRAAPQKSKTIPSTKRTVAFTRKRRRKVQSRMRKEGIDAVAEDLGVTPKQLRDALSGENQFNAPKEFRVFKKAHLDNQLSPAGRRALLECGAYMRSMITTGTNIRPPETKQEWVAVKTLHEVGLITGDMPPMPTKMA